MSEYEPYSMRKKRATQAGRPVVYHYDNIPEEMKAQAFYAISMALGPTYSRQRENYLWVGTEQAIKVERGFFEGIARGSTSNERVMGYIRHVESPEHFLDAVELSLRKAQNDLPLNNHYGISPKQKEIIDAINELNKRFAQHNLGYAFSGWPGIITRVDSQYIHAEVVESAIRQLSDAGWDGPLDEFLAAHRHYRHADHKEAMNEALKAFESTMKAIIQDRGWHYEENWQARRLIEAFFNNQLLPTSLESYFGGIRSVLESGVPTLRNRQSGHGQGTEVSEVPGYMAAFTLHLTASNIVFLLSAHAETPKTESKQ